MGFQRTAETGPARARFSWWSGLLLLCLSVPVSQTAAQSEREPLAQPASPELLRVRTLIRSNVLGLAERIMEEQGPPQLPNGEWLNWERQLWALYKASGKWDRLVNRVQQIPPAFPEVVREEAEREVIAAYIALERGADARAILRRYLMSDEISEREKIPLRRQVIESFIAEDRLAEANAAARVFLADFRPQDPDWLLLAGRVALRSGNPGTAVNLLAPLDAPAARLLALWGRLEAGTIAPDEALVRAGAMLDDEQYEPVIRPLLAVMVSAAGASGQERRRTDLLERYLLAPQSLAFSVTRSLPRFEPADLVESYSTIARNRANSAGYLAGEEAGWSAFARLLPAEDDVARRGVWAHISTRAADRSTRVLARDAWVNAAIDGDRTGLISLLFGEDAPLGTLDLSPATALRLSNFAIEAGDIQLAAEASANVTAPPPGMSRDDWLLYTGRISIIAGRYDQGADRIRQWIDGRSRLSGEDTDRVLQPIFELQTVEQHALAIELLERVNERSPGGKYVRELSFWIAESHDALGEYMKAADHFLFSAMQKDNGFDQWGESARYRAADALLQGNFFADARTLFEDLLKRASDENRIQALNGKIQEIWLRESSLRETTRTLAGDASSG